MEMRTKAKKRLLLVVSMVFTGFLVVTIRLSYVMIAQADKYLSLAKNLHQRDREIKAPRGNIYDRNGVNIASNKAVYSISVIYSQITDREKIKSNVEKSIADRIRRYKLEGIKVDEDYKRVYPYDKLASKVLGFTGGDNQGILGLEVFYDKYLKGKTGRIRTLTDGKGVEIDGAYEEREEPVSGNDLYTSLDVNLQNYAVQACRKVKKEKKAKQVSMILMNPQNGEIYAMVNEPEYNLNKPFSLSAQKRAKNSKKQQEYLNKKWRNSCLNDTYEPGSVFKIITATAGLELSKVQVNDHFNCSGFRIVEDRKIRCHKVGGHGSETFKEGVMNSCNPVFMDVGARVGVDGMYQTFKKLGLFEKTGISLPGEAIGKFYDLNKINQHELATMSFGEKFTITPIQMISAVSTIANDGVLVQPQLVDKITNTDTGEVTEFKTKEIRQVISKSTTDKVKSMMESVVSEGSGYRVAEQAKGFSIGAKTGTSEPTSSTSKDGYTASFVAISPVENTKIVLLVILKNPKGSLHNGGQIAAPTAGKMFAEILPYMGIESGNKVNETNNNLSESDLY